MKVLRAVIVVAAAAILAVSAIAQGGGGRQGFGMRMMGGGDSSGLMLLQRADVQKELNLTDDQKTKLTALQEKARDDMREIFQNANGDREAMQQGMQKYMQQMQKDAAAILTKDQAARLREINIQISGNRAALFPDVQKELGLSDAQVSKIKDLQTKQNEANQALFQKMRDQEITREELQDSMKKNNDTFDSEIGKILTQDQKDKLKKMGGKEFKADNNGG